MNHTDRLQYIHTAVEAIDGLTSDRRAEIKAGLAAMPSIYVDAETGALKFTPPAYAYVRSQGAVLASDDGANGAHRQWEV